MYNSGYFSDLTVTVFTLTNCIEMKRAHLNFSLK